MRKNDNNSHTIHNLTEDFFHVKNTIDGFGIYKRGKHKFELKRMF